MEYVDFWNAKYSDDLVVGAPDQTEGSFVFTHANSDLFTTKIGGDLPSGKKSFMDAALIKYFNGGNYYVIIGTKNSLTIKPYWKIIRTNENYVEKVCNENP